jgi:hypothetical protein
MFYTLRVRESPTRLSLSKPELIDDELWMTALIHLSRSSRGKPALPQLTVDWFNNFCDAQLTLLATADPVVRDPS